MSFVKPLEIPYNFDKKLIDQLYERDSTGETYHSIYIAPYWEDYFSAKYFYIHVFDNNSNNIQNGKDMNVNRRMSREEYTSHIAYIESKFPGKVMLLLQQNEILMDDTLLRDYYIKELGITKFCVGSVEQAKILKEINPNFELVGSITMKAEPEDLQREDYKKYFDSFVLWFPYNRDIDKVKNLPKDFKYILLVNCDCSIFCKGTHHWLAKNREDEMIKFCVKVFDRNQNRNLFENNKYTIRIFPKDLILWKDCVDYFKLQGREFSTEYLMADVIKYSKDYEEENSRCPEFVMKQRYKHYQKMDEKEYKRVKEIAMNTEEKFNTMYPELLKQWRKDNPEDATKQ